MINIRSGREREREPLSVNRKAEAVSYICAFSNERIRFSDHRPLPEIKRIPGLKLSGQAFADIVMVFEFLHNFGETLGFGEGSSVICSPFA